MAIKFPMVLTTTFLAAAVAIGQIRHDTAKTVEPSDPIYPLLAAYQKQVADAYAREDVITPKFSKWVEVESAAAKRLFPELRFASVEWDEGEGPKFDQRFIGRAMGLQTTLAVDPKAKAVVSHLSGHGNYEPYGKLLVDRKIVLKNEADAKTIWDAFCDIHHRHWKAQPHKQVDNTEWRLGHSSYDQTTGSAAGFKTVVTRTHYMRVRVDEKTGEVKSWESVIESANERRVPVKDE